MNKHNLHCVQLSLSHEVMSCDPNNGQADSFLKSEDAGHWIDVPYVAPCEGAQAARDKSACLRSWLHMRARGLCFQHSSRGLKAYRAYVSTWIEAQHIQYISKIETSGANTKRSLVASKRGCRYLLNLNTEVADRPWLLKLHLGVRCACIPKAGV